jgi:hypothetical protein
LLPLEVRKPKRILVLERLLVTSMENPVTLCDEAR